MKEEPHCLVSEYHARAVPCLRGVVAAFTNNAPTSRSTSLLRAQSTSSARSHPVRLRRQRVTTEVIAWASSSCHRQSARCRVHHGSRLLGLFAVSPRPPDGAIMSFAASPAWRGQSRVPRGEGADDCVDRTTRMIDAFIPTSGDVNIPSGDITYHPTGRCEPWGRYF
ncbi:hypothetical protein BD626DRAFT_95458 [Schizophyllum amplum]|uniref:Uncharacterized protein n=1 Tax=Schizophyllum amplum TaxID=97359 RepID=A0A550C831_9AGAR|nr:hypothetical protein BD626DRAFT_95458 [Auriculariopsis ampla]